MRHPDGKRRRSGYGSGAKGRRRALERAMRHWEEVRPEDAARLRVRWEGGGTHASEDEDGPLFMPAPCDTVGRDRSL